MNLLVTGGAGFIGSNYIYNALKKDNAPHIVCLDKLTYAGNELTLEKAKKHTNFRFVQGDIADRTTVFSLFSEERFDAVINFAAESHVDRSISSAAEFIHTNVLGVQTLLDAALHYNVRFHQVSTDEVYGQLPLNRPEPLFSENSPIDPSSPYSASKAGGDLLCISYYKTHNLPVTISRCCNNYGPFHYPEKLIPLMVVKAMNNEPLPIYGTGKNVRDWIHVIDHIKAIDMILAHGTLGGIYNIGIRDERDNLSVAKEILKIMGKDENLITFVEDRKGHDLRYAVDPSKIEKELGFAGTVLFKSGLQDTIQWYLDNKDWWKPLYKSI